MLMALDERKKREREFHDRAYERQYRTGGIRKIVYSIHERIANEFHRIVLNDCAGKKALEYGCGEGSMAFLLAARGADVTGIDISKYAIDVARKEARQKGLDIRFIAMDAENLEFQNESFDLVCGGGILHHLDLGHAVPEIQRVL